MGGFLGEVEGTCRGGERSGRGRARVEKREMDVSRSDGKARWIFLLLACTLLRARILKEGEEPSVSWSWNATETRAMLEEAESELRAQLAKLWFKPSHAAAPAPEGFDLRETPELVSNPVCKKDRNCGNQPQRAVIIQMDVDPPEQDDDLGQISDGDFEDPSVLKADKGGLRVAWMDPGGQTSRSGVDVATRVVCQGLRNIFDETPSTAVHATSRSSQVDSHHMVAPMGKASERLQARQTREGRVILPARENAPATELGTHDIKHQATSSLAMDMGMEPY